MATSPPRVPPRFVPTLTEVVQLPVVQGSAVASAAVHVPAKPALAKIPESVPPRVDLPTRSPQALPPVLQTRSGHAATADMLQKSPAATGAPVAARAGPQIDSSASPVSRPQTARVAQPAGGMPDGVEEYMIHRVMQRVDVVLDQRLRDAIATVVQEQTRSVLPRLREEIESVVRHAVYEAVADELASGQG